jgi:hypothetical protein
MNNVKPPLSTVVAMNGPKPQSKDTIKWTKEIFSDPSHNNDISKFPTHEELEELKSAYDLTSKQIMAEFHKMKKQSISKCRAISKSV